MRGARAATHNPAAARAFKRLADRVTVLPGNMSGGYIEDDIPTSELTIISVDGDPWNGQDTYQDSVIVAAASRRLVTSWRIVRDDGTVMDHGVNPPTQPILTIVAPDPGSGHTATLTLRDAMSAVTVPIIHYQLSLADLGWSQSPYTGRWMKILDGGVTTKNGSEWEEEALPLGAHLVSIPSADENGFVASLATGLTPFIGIIDGAWSDGDYPYWSEFVMPSDAMLRENNVLPAGDLPASNFRDWWTEYGMQYNSGEYTVYLGEGTPRSMTTALALPEKSFRFMRVKMRCKTPGTWYSQYSMELLGVEYLFGSWSQATAAANHDSYDGTYYYREATATLKAMFGGTLNVTLGYATPDGSSSVGAVRFTNISVSVPPRAYISGSSWISVPSYWYGSHAVACIADESALTPDNWAALIAEAA